MTTKTTTVTDAAKVIVDAEVAALTALSEALAVFDAAMVAIQDDLPSNLPMDAARIINELRVSYGYRRQTEIPGLLNRYVEPAAPLYAPGMPQGTGNA